MARNMVRYTGCFADYLNVSVYPSSVKFLSELSFFFTENRLCPLLSAKTLQLSPFEEREDNL